MYVHKTAHDLQGCLSEKKSALFPKYVGGSGSATQNTVWWAVGNNGKSAIQAMCCTHAIAFDTRARQSELVNCVQT